MFQQGQMLRITSRIPWNVLWPLFLIMILGIINLSSAAQSSRPDLYLSQMTKFIFAFGLALIISFIDLRLIRKFSLFGYGGAIFLLLLVLAVGATAKGGQRWLVLGPLRLQPSDPAKILLILALADYCAKYWPGSGYGIMSLIRPLNISRPLAFLALVVGLLIKERHDPKILSHDLLVSKIGMMLMLGLIVFGFSWFFLSLYNLIKKGYSFEMLVAPIDLAVLPFLLVAVEPDLATGLLLLSIAGIMLLYVGIKKSALFLGFLSFLFVGVSAYFTVLKDYQRDRITSFLNPEADIQGKGYQAVQSIIAIGSGKILGKGYMEGTQTQLSFLPENATDFAFSVWAEEWGFLASIFLLSLYLFLLRGILLVSLKAHDNFARLICVGMAANIFVHVMVNVGMVTGLLPVAGVPCVLLSYGGSSLTTLMIGVGLVLNVAFHRGVK